MDDAHESLQSQLDPDAENNIADSSIMLHAPSSDLDHEALGLFDPDHEIHNEMLLTGGADDQSFNMINNENGLIEEHNEQSASSTFANNDQFLFEEQSSSLALNETDAKCEYCGSIGLQSEFFSKSKRFCRLECSRKYAALFQKKGSSSKPPSTLNSSNNRSNKRKLSRLGPQVKKFKSENSNESVIESGLQQVCLDEVNPDTKYDEITMAENQFNDDSNSGTNWMERDFDWKEYLAQTNEKPAPERLFKHTFKAPSLTSVHKGMKVEVINDRTDLNKESDVHYWLSTIIDVDTNMMLLRYCAFEDDSNDFWIDIRSKHVHPVGWCYKNRKGLVPPSEIRGKEKDWQRHVFEELTGSRTFSGDFLNRVEKGHYNKFDCGSKVEVSDKRQNLSMCVATIVKIVGDRLCLRYDGLEEGIEVDHWTHFLSSDIHPVGWSQLVGLTLSPPFGWKKSLTEWMEFLAENLHESNDAQQDCFVPESMGSAPSDAGSFEVGMKLEALDPLNPLSLSVASVVQTLKYNNIVVNIDQTDTFFICHASSSNIFPVGFAKQNKAFLTPPKEYGNGKQFDWTKYLLQKDSIAAPSSLFLHLKKRVTPFEVGTKVEAVDLREPSLICPATIVSIHGSLLRVHFDGWDPTFDQFVSHDTLDLFPVYWCEKNNHPLQPPGTLLPDPVVESLRLKKQSTISRRGHGHGRPGRPPGSLNKSGATKAVGRGSLTGKGAKGGKAGGKAGKLKKQQSSLISNVPFERQRFGNLREMRKGGELGFSFNQKCACGPFLNPDVFRKFPNSISGYLNGPPHQNCIRKSLLEIVNAACDPNQLLELFSREFYQSKKHKDLKLDNTICLEITGKNGKRFLRRVKGPSRSGILSKYLQRICEMLQCCPYLIVEDRFPSGKCSTNCHEKYADGEGVSSALLPTTTILEDDVIGDEMMVDDMDDEDDDDDKSNHDNKSVVSSSSTKQTVPLDSPCDPSSSSTDLGIDPLNLLDQEFLRSKDPREWSVQEVMDFMTAIGCPAHAPSFQKQEIDGKALFLLSFDELESLTENKLGPITKLKDALQSLKKMWQIPLTKPSVSAS